MTLYVSVTQHVGQHPPTRTAVASPFSAVRLHFLSSPVVSRSAGGFAALMLMAGDALLPVRSSFWLIVGIVVVCAAIISWSERTRARTVSVNLFMLALAIRVTALLVFTGAALREGGPFLGPDSTGYFNGATEIVARGFDLGTNPLVFFGTYDISHYYLFAVAIRFLHADLFGLQTLNIGLTALAAPLSFAIARNVLPRVARAVGLFVAFYPSLIVLSAVDLLKDPSVVFATLLSVWAILRIVRARTLRPVLFYSLPAAIALMYLRTGRLYSFAYLEAATAAAGMWVIIFPRRLCFRTRAAAAGLLFVFSAAEIVPARVGWPISPTLFVSQVQYALGTPTMRIYSAGLVDRLEQRNRTEARYGQMLATAPGQTLEVPHGHTLEVPHGHTLPSFAANLLRRVLGPFPWIPPQHWTFREIQSGDYLLYPGILIWYGILPFLLVGLLIESRRLFRRDDVRFATAFLWIFTVLYFAQYLVLNVSYRQREVIVPVLFLFACLGVLHVVARRRFALWYGAYWTALGLLAAAHISVRAWLK